MKLYNYQRAFNGGEVAEAMYGRIDDGKYQTGLATCKNFIVEPQGALSRRPGFEYVNETRYSNRKCRLIPFSFSVTQTMVLEFGHKYVRFHHLGQTLFDGDEPYEVPTPYTSSEVFDIHYVQSADVLTLVHPKHAPMELRRYGALDWRLVTIQFGSSLSAPTLVSVVQTINESVSNPTDYSREYAVTALLADGTQESSKSNSIRINCNPYGEGAYNTITWNAVTGAGMYRVYRNQGGVWAYIGQTTETSLIDEKISPDASITPPIYDDVFMTAGSITSFTVVDGGSGYEEPSSVDDGSISPQASLNWIRDDGTADTRRWGGSTPTTGCWESSRGHPGLSAEVVDLSGTGSGATVALKTTKGSYQLEVESGDSTDWETWYTTTVTGYTITARGHDYTQPAIKITATTNHGFPNYVRYIELDASSTPSGADLVVEISITDPTGTGASATPVIEDGVITGVTLVSGGKGYTNPQVRVVSNYGSGASITAKVPSSGDFPGAVSYFEQRRWFGGSTNRPNHIWATKSGTESNMSYSLPTQDDDRIAVRVAAREVNRIQHIVPLAQLMLLTGAAEWRVSPVNSDAITPASMSVRPQSYVGSNNVQPLVVNSSMLFAASRGGHLRECGYNWQASGYVSSDVCLRAPHLFDGYDITDMTYAKAPWPIAFVVSSSGKILSFTYVPEQGVGAFSTIETEGEFESVCAIGEEYEDRLYAVVKRRINGRTVRFVERMAAQQYESLTECVFLDCSAVYDGEPTQTVSGLTWLEGATVSILADGSVEPDQVVTNGKITLDHDASYVRIGLPYQSDIKTLPISLALQDGSYGSMHRKNVRDVAFRVVKSSGVFAGPDFDHLTEYPARSIEFAGSPPDLLSEEISQQVIQTWGDAGTVCMRQRYPLPLRVVSMSVKLETA